MTDERTRYKEVCRLLAEAGPLNKEKKKLEKSLMAQGRQLLLALPDMGLSKHYDEEFLKAKREQLENAKLSLGTWECEDERNPVGTCVLTDDKDDEACIFCGEPDERQ